MFEFIIYRYYIVMINGGTRAYQVPCVYDVKICKMHKGKIYISKKKSASRSSRTQQSRQREPSVETLSSPLSAEFWRHCVMRERRNGNINLTKYFISSSGDRTHNQSVLQSHFVPLHHDWPHIYIYLSILIKFHTGKLFEHNNL